MRPYGAPTIFAEMSALAVRHGAVNLGQGFPDTDGPREMLDRAAADLLGGLNQYAPGRGMPVLREAVARHQAHWYGLTLDPETDVLITVGATEAIAAALMALVEPGDEVLMIEPYYDSYAAGIALAGGVRRTVPLAFPSLDLDPAALEAAITNRTRVILINTPHNPTGKVFGLEELQAVAAVAQRHGLWVIVDEVYEHLTYDGRRHIPLATLEGMAERTLTVSSVGKTFSVTGWKTGWVSGPAHLVDAVTAVKQYLTFVGVTHLQPAAAVGLGLPDAYFREVAAELQAKRDLLVAALLDVGIPVAPSQGTYFVVADLAPLGVSDAEQFCRRMPSEIGVVGVPLSAFCDDRAGVATLVRFAFCKRLDVLDEAVRRLHRLVN
jgi:N-succinyldiaminopimelate aminotransferase